MSTRPSAHLMLEIFDAIEQRDGQRFADLCCSDVEFHWPASLPYGGITRGPGDDRPNWSETWLPLQPTERERRMDPRVVAASEEEVVVLWQQRGLSATGDRFEGPVLGLYRLREGKLAQARMFYFDTAALASFLARAGSAATSPRDRG